MRINRRTWRLRVTGAANFPSDLGARSPLFVFLAVMFLALAEPPFLWVPAHRGELTGGVEEAPQGERFSRNDAPSLNLHNCSLYSLCRSRQSC